MAVLLAVQGVGCSRPLGDLPDALDAWNDGMAHYGEGEFGEAAEDFSRAAELDPASPSLAGWHATALARTGDLRGAVAHTDAFLASHPGDPSLVYNRACWLVALGDLARAEQDLALILEGRPDLAARAAEDPDLAPVRALALRFVAVEPLAVSVHAETGPVLLGSTWELTLEVEVPANHDLGVAYEGPEANVFAPVRVVDIAMPTGAGTRRTLVYDFLATGGGSGTMGPWRVHALGPRGVAVGEVVVPAVPWTVTAAPGMNAPSAPPQPLARSFPNARGLLGEGSRPAVRAWEDRVLVVHAPGDRVEVDHGAVAEPPLRMEVRDGDRVTALGVAFPFRPGSERCRVRVSRGGVSLLDQEVRRDTVETDVP